MNNISIAQNIPDILNTGKTLFEILKNIGTNEVIAGIGTIMGISGYSLRDLTGKIKMSNFVNKFKEEFNNVNSIDEEQNTILFDGFFELEDYIKNCKDLNDNVFEKISELIINGIKEKDILTREYIKILKNMSWIELKILIESQTIEIHKKETVHIGNESFKKINFIEWENFRAIGLEKLEKLKLPKELIGLSIDKLKNLYLLNQDGYLISYETIRLEPFSRALLNVKICFLSDLGIRIVNLLNNKGELKK